MTSNGTLCPCCSKKPFDACCAAILMGDKPAPSAEALMRARYSAYAKGNEAYLLNTWHAATRPATIEFDPQQRWLGLKVINAQGDNDTALVEFVARFKIAGKAYRLHEISRFRQGKRGWVYIDGTRGPTDSNNKTF